MNDLSPMEKEIAMALEQLKEKSLITESILTKKVRANAKIEGKNKAGLSLKDLEGAVTYLAEQSQLYFGLHLNSANTLLIKREDECRLLDPEAKKRRQASEKSISLLTKGDLRSKNSGGKSVKKRTDRKKLNINNWDDGE